MVSGFISTELQGFLQIHYLWLINLYPNFSELLGPRLLSFVSLVNALAFRLAFPVHVFHRRNDQCTIPPRRL